MVTASGSVLNPRFVVRHRPAAVLASITCTGASLSSPGEWQRAVRCSVTQLDLTRMGLFRA